MTAPAKHERDGLLRLLSTLCAQLEPVFGNASEVLFQQVDRITHASKLMKDVEQRTSPAAMIAVEAESVRLMAELDVILTTFENLHRLFARIKDEAQDENKILRNLRRDIQVAEMIAFNARVVSSAVSFTRGTIDTFSKSVRDLLHRADQDLSTLETIQTRANARLVDAVDNIESMGAEVTATQFCHDQIPAFLRDLSKSAEAQDAAVTFGAAAADVEAALFAALTSLQGGDAIRQRLEHVISVIAFCDVGGAQADAAWTVAQSLLGALRTDLLSNLATIDIQIKAMRRPLERSTRTLATLTASGMIESATAASLALADRAIAATRLAAHGSALSGELHRMIDEYDEKSKAAERLAEIEDQILMLGINATLMSRGKGADGQAMAEVARQLRDISQVIVGATSRLMAISRAQRSTMLLASDTDATSSSTSMANDDTDPADLTGFGQTMARLSTLSLADFRETLSDVMDGLSRIADVSASLHVSDCKPRTLADMATQKALQHLRDIYTLQIEREIHDSVLGIVAKTDNAPVNEDESAELSELFG